MNTAKRGGEVGLHKLDILTESVHYIFELKSRLAAFEQRSFTIPPPAQPPSVPVSGTTTPITSPPTPVVPADTAKLKIQNLLG
jgi:hypothetical protein